MVESSTSIEPEQERLVRWRRLSLKEPVEERPPVALVHSDVAGELRHARALRLPGEARHSVGVPLVAGGAGQRLRGGREGGQGKSGDEAEEETCCRHRHGYGSVGDGLGAWDWE